MKPVYCIEPISNFETHFLRKSVLRPDNKDFTGVFPGDERDSSSHFAAKISGEIVGIVSLYENSNDSLPKEGFQEQTWQLRGLAVDPEKQGLGIGGALTRHCIEFCRQQNAEIIWCNAREEVAELYRRNGFSTIEDLFIIDGVGPHFLMFIKLK